MLQPEFYTTPTQSLSRPQSEVKPLQQSRKVSGHPGRGSTNSLVEALIPEKISPAKRAVIEQLVSLWLSQPKTDIA
jgi:hypothetical protein